MVPNLEACVGIALHLWLKSSKLADKLPDLVHLRVLGFKAKVLLKRFCSFLTVQVILVFCLRGIRESYLCLLEISESLPMICRVFKVLTCNIHFFLFDLVQLPVEALVHPFSIFDSFSFHSNEFIT